jgi:hypothetical protein
MYFYFYFFHYFLPMYLKVTQSNNYTAIVWLHHRKEDNIVHVEQILLHAGGHRLPTSGEKTFGPKPLGANVPVLNQTRTNGGIGPGPFRAGRPHSLAPVR